MKKWIIAVLLGSFCGFGATNAHAWYEGQILDADTKEPIAGVVVLMNWSQASVAGSFYVDAFETVTDEQGRFSLPRWWSINPWKLWTTDHLIIIFKSGYKPIVGGSGAWRALTGRHARVPRPPEVWKVERGQPIILLEKAGQDRGQRSRDFGWGRPGGVPDEKMPLLQEEMNKEFEFLRVP